MNSTPRFSLGIGPSGGIYFIVACLIIVAGIYTQANLLFWAFGLMLGGLLASILVAYYSLFRLQVRRLEAEHAVVGHPLVIRYMVTNPKRFMPAFNLVLMEQWGRGVWGRQTTGPLADHPPRLGGHPLGWLMHVGPAQSVQAEAVCWPKRRGPLPFERIILSTTFPFGILRCSLHFQEPGQVLVYPRLYHITRSLWCRLSAIDPAGHMRIEQGGGTEEFYGLRRYRPGDSLRSIDWKHTARTGQLISREMTLPAPPRVMLGVDLTSPPTGADTAGGDPVAPAPPFDDPLAFDLVDPVERAISLAASIICSAHLQGYQIGLVILGSQPIYYRIHHSLPHRNHMLDALATLALTPASPDAAAAGPVTFQRSWPQPTVVVRAHASCTALTSGHSAKRLLLDADLLHDYVHATPVQIAKLLGRPAGSRSPAKLRRLQSAWT